MNLQNQMTTMNFQPDNQYYQNHQQTQLSEFITVTVFPCGSDEVNETQEKPYELQIHKKMNENSLKEILMNNRDLWQPIFS